LTEIQYIKGVGPKRAELFHKLGIFTVRDLFYHAPRRYIDRSIFTKIADLHPGQDVTVIGKVSGKSVNYARRGFTIFNLMINDESGFLPVKWFNQPYLKDRFEIGQTVVLSGSAKYDRGLAFLNPEYEVIDDEDAELIHTGRIVPLHPSTTGLSARQIRAVLKAAMEGHLSDISESLPEAVIQNRGLMPLKNAVQEIHFPQSAQFAQKARERLAFEELYYLQILLLQRRKNFSGLARAVPVVSSDWRRSFESVIPFTPTAAQERVMREITGDLSQAKPMHRLLQGDVGSGKTLVAFAAIIQAAGQNLQTALMAPTEILAEQHYAGIKPWLDKLSISSALLTSKTPPAEKKEIHRKLGSGEILLAIGTHALIQEQVNFKALALAVIDEQHRFGVAQRAKIRAKGKDPHLLVMTATPIPRTLAMTAYGDLDISVIDELPPGRQPIVTKATSEANRVRVYAFLSDQMKTGRQIYVIYPIIEESEKTDLKAAIKMHRHLSDDVFKDFKTGLIHGQLAFDERQQVMEDFRRGAIQLLVATTVIEVGIDVPNATVMVIEHAERFGLSQLHQLRGRVGRGRHKSYCILMSGTKSTPEAQARLSIMQSTSDGFKIAEEDLKIRGPGELWGTRQHGLPALKIADLTADARLVAPAKQLALETMQKVLSTDEQALLDHNLKFHFPDAHQLIQTG
jgi:ATP-dependent DNA helicase RecG